MLSTDNLAARIDHTLLKPEATRAQIVQLCAEARQAHFASACVPPCYVSVAANELYDSGVAVCTVVGFPLGYQLTKVKFFEAHQALSEGATEIDVVMNVAAFKSGRYEEVEDELGQLAELCHFRGGILKVIIETALLSEAEIRQACDLCAAAGADFVKTSTGFSTRGASVEDIQIMRDQLPAHIRIKASGGIRTHEQAVALVQAGADRLGASAGLALLTPAADSTAHEPTAY
ncbi:deoxyribose-phosphate aldolase [Hymenobacter sp. 15J16-1T3B]|uniref:deoxyribose-phosphate aldolase n=1 Tax=Hymenobacter sp. 15J16-1T3B TaxID=2886941 RepID=UPI001D1257F3|nr:deoxyribose-phosphate aldolase [Hymenobacter sp. 15J16-1T3B]MCC3157686.1 deoxyribose-phosphate aldolase [Hymenobacter sp. 15J16-1T3B]